MKKLIFTYILVLAGLVTVHAQQIPLYSQYYYNQFLYNPAMAGYNNFGNIYLIDRMQWTGIPGAPVTRAFTIDGPLKTNKVGLGFGIYDDQTDIFDRMGAFGSYSYNIHFAQNNDLRLGLSAGFLDNRIDFSKVRVKDPGDQTILTQFQDKSVFDGTFGVSYHYKNLLLGFAAPQLLAPHIQYADNSSLPVYYSLVRHYIVSGQYDIHFSGDKWKLQPMFFSQFAQGAPMMLDAGMNLKYKDFAWLGLVWRKDFAISASAGIKLYDRITLGYSYDMMTNTISPYAGATHEFVVGYTFGRAAGQNHDLEQKLKDLNERLDKNQKINKTTDDSLRNELNKANHKMQKQDSTILKNRRDFEDFKKEMLDSIGKLHSVGGIPNQSPSYVLDNITFNDRDVKWSKGSTRQLDELSSILQNNPKMKIEIDGFCDDRGTDAFNMDLSKRRADAVKDYLVQHGAKEEQMVTKGFGKSKPVAKNTTPQGMAKNRRVEIKILNK
jgi:type IX secretion system PorP/SprF family membrane protein